MEETEGATIHSSQNPAIVGTWNNSLQAGKVHFVLFMDARNSILKILHLHNITFYVNLHAHNTRPKNVIYYHYLTQTYAIMPLEKIHANFSRILIISTTKTLKAFATRKHNHFTCFILNIHVSPTWIMILFAKSQ